MLTDFSSLNKPFYQRVIVCSFLKFKGFFCGIGKVLRVQPPIVRFKSSERLHYGKTEEIIAVDKNNPAIVCPVLGLDGPLSIDFCICKYMHLEFVQITPKKER